MAEEVQPVAEVETDAEGESDIDEDFRVLYNDTQDAEKRLVTLGDNAAKNGHPELAAIYREMAGTLVSLIRDVTATCGSAFADIEEELDQVASGAIPTESVLLEEDATRYVVYFEQILRLLGELRKSVPSDDTGDEQRNIFDTLIRMTNELLGFTKDIMVGGSPDAGDSEEDDDEDEEPDDE